jgi:hypothetical protein
MELSESWNWIFFYLFHVRNHIAGSLYPIFRINAKCVIALNGLQIYTKLVKISVYGFVDTPPIFGHHYALGQSA